MDGSKSEYFSRGQNTSSTNYSTLHLVARLTKMEPTIIEEEQELETIVSPPRKFGSNSHESPQTKQLEAQSDEDVINRDRPLEVVEQTPITPQRLNSYKYTTPTRREKSLNKIFHRNTKVKYYRIIYRGVVSLMSKPDEGCKSGAYVSYGEIIASLHELDVPEGDASNQQIDENVRTPIRNSPQSCVSNLSSSPATSRVASTTSTSLPLAPSMSFMSNNQSREKPSNMQRIIQVDEVLTGGYAIDASAHATSHTHCTPIRSNAKNVSFAPNTAPEEHCAASPKTPKRNKKEVGEHVIANAAPIKHHGYLYQNRNGVKIAECIAAPPLLCQAGTFYYRVICKDPLPILAGPCADAPQTKAMVLPGTVHEISLRMGSLDHSGNSNGMEDGIIYLRLSHRRGWIADRRFVTSFHHEHIMARHRYHYGRTMLGSNENPSISLELVMREVSDYVDVSSFGIRDDVSLGGTSISSNSISTPANVIRTRLRPTRRREKDDIRNGMIVQSTKMIPSRMTKIGEGGDSLPSSDLSVLSEQTKKSDRVHSSQRDIGTHNLENMRLSSHNMNNPQMKPNMFLIRVTAINGLKILDAPHFQVNNLIRGKNTGAFLGLKKKRDLLINSIGSKTNPPSIFPASAPPAESHSELDNTSSWVFDTNGKHRILPRGALFEASKRMERAPTNYAPGSGLIKLADNTGWAVIPSQGELQEQHQSHNANIGIGISETEALQAYEEVGNAIVPGDKAGRSSDENFLWVRIIQQTGVLVSCSPSGGGQKEKAGPVRTLQNYPQRQPDDDAMSTVSSTFFDAFRSNRKAEAGLDSQALNTHNRLTKLQSLKSNPIIQCGNCMKVQPWVSSSSHTENQSFVKLYGGQGWIPRIIHGAQYSVDVKKPDIRQGSFWFRVQPSDGVKVRVGPSGRSRAIKSNNEYFQFECGEYLRASEVLIIHGHVDTDDDAHKSGHPSESFAKLYRNHGGHANEENPLSMFATPGEWVYVHCNGYLYLEECVNPPSIERHQDGWRFEVVSEAGTQIRRGPSFSAPLTGKTLLHCASVLINEKVTASGESLTWLRLKDGRGWIHNISEQNDVVVKAYRSKKNHQTDGSVNKLISRLGLR